MKSVFNFSQNCVKHIVQLNEHFLKNLKTQKFILNLKKGVKIRLFKQLKIELEKN